MDIRPPRKVTVPKRRLENSGADGPKIQKVSADTLPTPIKPDEFTDSQKLSLRRRFSKKSRTIAAAVVGFFATALLVSFIWYSWALLPRSGDGTQVRVVVAPGDTVRQIAQNLYDHKLIRSRAAFNIYTQLTGNRAKLQAGGYALSANQDVQSIVAHIVEGKTDEFNITIPPGLTLKELRKVFIKNGYSDSEVNEAYAAKYDSPLLTSRPAGADLEGYIYPETYKMGANQTLEALLRRSFDQMYSLLQDKGYLEEFKKRGLSLHQALTLASIVQKEVPSPADQKQVAQVFLKRYGMGMHLGSDVTFMYAADQMGVKATVDLDSPYNTRKYVGLPPGPIANMNPSALEAVAFPAAGDYLYFVAGDDGTTYYALTEDQHNANVAAHCTTLCQ